MRQQAFLGGKLGLDKSGLPRGGAALRGKPVQLRKVLLASPLKLCDLLGEGAAPRLEQAALPLGNLTRIGADVHGDHKRRQEVQRFQPLALSVEAGLTGERLKILAFDNGQLGLQQSPLQPHQYLPGLHPRALSYQNGFDHTAIRVLDHLQIALNLDLPADHDGAGKGGRDRPAAETGDQQQRSQRPGQKGAQGLPLRGAAHSPPPAAAGWARGASACGRTRSVWLRTTWRNTSSRGPKAA